MSAKPIKVALAGATGNLGPAILTQLLASPSEFSVTVLTRSTSTSSVPRSFPPSITVLPVDYTSLSSLTTALAGHTAVVSTLPPGSFATEQRLLIEAGAQAGVQRFIPGDFGSDTLNPKAAALPAYQGKIEAQNHLKEKAEQTGMSYTIVCNGPFLDWGIEVGLLLDLKERKARLYDGGERLFSTTTLESVGKAVVGVLRKLEETKNRAVYVQDVAVSARGLYEIGKRVTPGKEWTEEVVSVDDAVAEGWAELKKENPDMGKMFMSFVTAAIWGEGYGAKFEKTDNELLGIKELSKEELEAVVARYA